MYLLSKIRKFLIRFGLTFIVVSIFYCEWVVYVKQQLYWPKMDCRDKGHECTKILFIADPQIQGDMAVPSPLNHIFNFDSDQYLETTFSVVIPYFKPDVLVYLGDLMDEGSISSMKQFHGYMVRLTRIFYVNYTLNVWLPGDNDIGGENEPVRQEKVEAFEESFRQPSVITYKNISFYKVNAITDTSPKFLENTTNNYRIVVSHYPVTLRYNLRTKVRKEINPHIYFCAHSHESKYAKLSKDLHPERRMYPFTAYKEILELSPNDTSMYEIYVPTCSYRMGTDMIGYGAAVFEHQDQTLRYAVFWSPKRFPYLFFYLGISLIAVMFVLHCLVLWAHKLSYRHRPSKQVSKSSLN